jgi:peptidoglycan/LPS O-acetylase OafA/YrhL
MLESSVCSSRAGIPHLPEKLMGPIVRTTGTAAPAVLPAQAGPGAMSPAAERGVRLGFRPDIEGLRAVAVLLVVLYHAGLAQFSGGYVGVDVFFVISGFLITAKLYGELTDRGTISAPAFWARRATRLLPASVLVLVVTMIGTWLWLPPTRFRSIGLDGMATAVYAINWRLAARGVDYLNVGAPPSPLQHFWSLAVEEQFYLIWPVLLLILAWRAGRPAGPRRATVIAALLALAVASLLLSIVQTRGAAPWSYFGSHTRAWELALGALLALATTELSRLPRPAAALLTWLGLAAVVVAGVRYTDATPFPGYAAALPVLGAALIIGGGCAAPSMGVSALLRHRPFQIVGRLSYSWYLWHWPVLIIAPAALGILPGPRRNLVLAAGSLILAAITFRLVEDPVRRHRWLRAYPRRGLGFGLALSAGAVVVALVGGQLAVLARPLAGADSDGGPGDPRPVIASASDPAAALRGLLQTAAGTPAAPGSLRPSLATAADDLPVVYRDGCHLDFAATDVKKSCVYGDVDADTTVVLFGDSHAAQWFPALDQIARDRHWRLVSLTKSACPVASVDVWQDILKRPYTECTRWRDRALAAVRAMHPAMVVFASLNTDAGGLIQATPDRDRTWVDGWLTSLDRVKQPGTERVLLSDTPFPKSNVPDCVASHLTNVSECAQGPGAALPEPRRRTMLAAAAAADGVTVLDPTPWLCTDAICPVILGDVLMYKDSSHISTVYSKVLAPVLAAGLP